MFVPLLGKDKGFASKRNLTARTAFLPLWDKHVLVAITCSLPAFSWQYLIYLGRFGLRGPSFTNPVLWKPEQAVPLCPIHCLSLWGCIACLSPRRGRWVGEGQSERPGFHRILGSVHAFVNLISCNRCPSLSTPPFVLQILAWLSQVFPVSYIKSCCLWLKSMG